MGNTATNVSTGKPKVSGAVFTAPLGTTLPTDAKTALDAAYVCLGFVSEDGIENNNEISLSAIKEWGGLTVYRSLDELKDEFKLKLIESLNVDVLKAVYGDSNVTKDSKGNIVVNVKADEPQERVWVFEIAMRGGYLKRIVVTDGAVTSRDSISYKAGDAIAYGVTISAYPNADGETHKEYIGK